MGSLVCLDRGCFLDRPIVTASLTAGLSSLSYGFALAFSRVRLAALSSRSSASPGIDHASLFVSIQQTGWGV